MLMSLKKIDVTQKNCGVTRGGGRCYLEILVSLGFSSVSAGNLRRFTAICGDSRPICDLRGFTADLRRFTRNCGYSRRCAAIENIPVVNYGHIRGKFATGPGYSEHFCSLHCKYHRSGGGGSGRFVPYRR